MGLATLYLPCICLTISSESETTRRCFTLCSTDHWSTPSRPEYSAIVVGLDAEELAQFGDNLALCVFDDSAVAGGAGIAAGTAVAVGCEPWAGRGGGGRGWVCK